jgi:alkanesulfonate monooxygenase SsuD/methylene tetrahydromethanopterin reductase-like flavin-dependent oxidoreductase (luciferase family)
MGGGAGPKTAAHIAEFCDGWMPIGGRHPLKGWEEVQKACEAIGRDPKTVELSMFGARPDAEALDELAELGFKRAIFALPQGPRDEVMAAVEEYAAFNDR